MALCEKDNTGKRKAANAFGTAAFTLMPLNSQETGPQATSVKHGLSVCCLHAIRRRATLRHDARHDARHHPSHTAR